MHALVSEELMGQYLMQWFRLYFNLPLVLFILCSRETMK